MAARMSPAVGWSRRSGFSAIATRAKHGSSPRHRHRTADIDRVKAELGIANELNIGSVGVKLCLIASGARDLYVNPAAKTKAWDSCAPEAILVGAGGRLSDLFGGANRLPHRAPPSARPGRVQRPPARRGRPQARAPVPASVARRACTLACMLGTSRVVAAVIASSLLVGTVLAQPASRRLLQRSSKPATW